MTLGKPFDRRHTNRPADGRAGAIEHNDSRKSDLLTCSGDPSDANGPQRKAISVKGPSAKPQAAGAGPTRPDRRAAVARCFGLSRQDVTDAQTSGPATPAALPMARAGTVVLVAGPSGSGKSSLLRAMRAATPACEWIDLADVGLPDVPLVDAFGDLTLDDAMARLARVGLAEAWLCFKTPVQLSEGQRWRLRLAIAVERATRRSLTDTPEARQDPTPRPQTKPDASSSRHAFPVLLCDEFAAVLDRVTAAVVARAVRKLVDAYPTLAAVVATSHDDLEAALDPDVSVRCDFDGRIDIRSLK